MLENGANEWVFAAHVGDIVVMKPPRELVLQASVAACLFVTVASFFAVQPIIDLAKHAARTLPF